LTSFLYKQSSYVNKLLFSLTLHQSLRLKICQSALEQDHAKENFPFEMAYNSIRACINASVGE
jgi:hypothetical protein